MIIFKHHLAGRSSHLHIIWKSLTYIQNIAHIHYQWFTDHIHYIYWTFHRSNTLYIINNSSVTYYILVGIHLSREIKVVVEIKSFGGETGLTCPGRRHGRWNMAAMRCPNCITPPPLLPVLKKSKGIRGTTFGAGLAAEVARKLCCLGALLP